MERTQAGTSGSDPDPVLKDIEAEKAEIYSLMLEVKMMKSLESTLTKERDKQVSTLTLSKYSLKQKSKKIDTITAECETLKTQLGDSVQ